MKQEMLVTLRKIDETRNYFYNYQRKENIINWLVEAQKRL